MTKATIALWATLVLIAVVTAILLANRPRKIIVDAEPPVGFPEDSFAHDSFEELLQIYVTPDGDVDYDRWQSTPESAAQLDAYLGAVSRFSPHNAPQRFKTRSDQLAYWMYAYNAYVIRTVLNNWPIDSVTDIKAPVEAVQGLGFFYQQRFAFGGEFMSLLAVENNIIRRDFRDPRIHFFLNCASESCPIARPELPTGDDLDELLATATADFIGDRKNVDVDHEKRVVYLSTIFKWYKSDFLNDLRIAGKPAENGLIQYVRLNASADLADDLARAADYRVTFRDYDWHINDKN